MKKRAYIELAELERTFWWHVGRMHIIDRQLGRLTKHVSKKPKILNIGAGTGGTIPTIAKYGTVTNVDTSDDAIALLKKSGNKVVKIDGRKLPFKDGSFDIVVAFDVLEHTKDDSKALKEWQRVLKPNGHMVLTVPAYQWLWSNHDEVNMHFRRYTTSSLKKVVQSVKTLKINKLSYMIVFSLPLIVGFRLLEKAKPKKKTGDTTNFVSLPRPINSTFISLLKLESAAQKYISFPAGTSVITVLTKK